MHYRYLIISFILIPLLYCETTTPVEQSAAITHHDITVKLNPEDHSITGRDRITAHFPGSIQGNEVRFLLNRAFTEVALVDSTGLSLDKIPIQEASKKYNQTFNSKDNDRFQSYVVNLDHPDSVINFTLSYKGIIDDTLKTNKQEYARGFATTTGIIDTQGVFLAGVSAWLPTQEGNKFTFSLKTYLPLGWQSISQGEEVSRGSEGDFQINRWVCDKPMEEVYLIAGKYIITEEDHHGIKVMTYTFQDDPQLTSRYREATKRYLDMYGEQIGEYPFKKFALVENFWQTGYGMPSFTLLGSQVIRLPFIISTSYGHEILHNWWGNGVYVDYEKGNWCEGLTNYMADHYYKKLMGQDAAYRRTMLQSYLNYVQEGRDFPLSQFTERHDPATQAIGYSKSAMIFHTLFKMRGEDKFFQAVRSFYHQYRFKAASWADIEAAFSKEYGDDLSWFFDQWINRAGAPFLKLEGVDLSPADDKWKVSITLSQEKPCYRLDIPVRISAKADTTITVTMSDKQQTFSFLLNEKPSQVKIDPEFDVFRKLNYSEIPPALSQTFGAQSSIIVLPGAADETKYAAYKKLAESWRASDAVNILVDREITTADLAGKAVFIFDMMNTLFPEFSKALPANANFDATNWQLNEKKFPVTGHTIVLTTRHPQSPDLAWSLIHADQIDDLPAVGRKLPHYGKYGYLVFKGSQNIYKGEWEINDSPLVQNLNE